MHCGDPVLLERQQPESGTADRSRDRLLEQSAVAQLPLQTGCFVAAGNADPPARPGNYLEEDDEATIDELAFAASCLAALTGNGYPEAAQALRDMIKKATRRRRGRGVA